MLVLTLVLVAVAVADVIRRPHAAWTSVRERTVWLVLMFIPVPVTLLSFSPVGPVLALVVLVVYLALRRGRDRSPTSSERNTESLRSQRNDA